MKMQNNTNTKTGTYLVGLMDILGQKNLLNKIISEPLTISAKEIKESMFEFYDSVYYKNMNETILSVVHKSEK